MPEHIRAPRVHIIPQNIRPERLNFARWEHNPTAVARMYQAIQKNPTLTARDAAALVNTAMSETGDKSPKVTPQTIRQLSYSRYGINFKDGGAQRWAELLKVLIEWFHKDKNIFSDHEYKRIMDTDNEKTPPID